MRKRSLISVAITTLLVAASDIYLSRETRDLVATIVGWILFLICLPVMIDLWKKRQRK